MEKCRTRRLKYWYTCIAGWVELYLQGCELCSHTFYYSMSKRGWGKDRILYLDQYLLLINIIHYLLVLINILLLFLQLWMQLDSLEAEENLAWKASGWMLRSTCSLCLGWMLAIVSHRRLVCIRAALPSLWARGSWTQSLGGKSDPFSLWGESLLCSVSSCLWALSNNSCLPSVVPNCRSSSTKVFVSH